MVEMAVEKIEGETRYIERVDYQENTEEGLDFLMNLLRKAGCKTLEALAQSSRWTSSTETQ